MRIYILVGVVLIVAGALVLLLGGTFTSQSEVMQVGGMTVSAEEQHIVPSWLAGVVILAGVVLVGVGVGRKA